MPTQIPQALGQPGATTGPLQQMVQSPMMPPMQPQMPSPMGAPMPMGLSSQQPGQVQGMLSQGGGTPDVSQFLAGAAGAKAYGGGRPSPNMGATPNKGGYAKRDAMRAAISKRG